MGTTPHRTALHRTARAHGTAAAFLPGTATGRIVLDFGADADTFRRNLLAHATEQRGAEAAGAAMARLFLGGDPHAYAVSPGSWDKIRLIVVGGMPVHGRGVRPDGLRGIDLARMPRPRLPPRDAPAAAAAARRVDEWWWDKGHARYWSGEALRLRAPPDCAPEDYVPADVAGVWTQPPTGWECGCCGHRISTRTPLLARTAPWNLLLHARKCVGKDEFDRPRPTPLRTCPRHNIRWKWSCGWACGMSIEAPREGEAARAALRDLRAHLQTCAPEHDAAVPAAGELRQCTHVAGVRPLLGGARPCHTVFLGGVRDSHGRATCPSCRWMGTGLAGDVGGGGAVCWAGRGAPCGAVPRWLPRPSPCAGACAGAGQRCAVRSLLLYGSRPTLPPGPAAAAAVVPLFACGWCGFTVEHMMLKLRRGWLRHHADKLCKQRPAGAPIVAVDCAACGAVYVGAHCPRCTGNESDGICPFCGGNKGNRGGVARHAAVCNARRLGVPPQLVRCAAGCGAQFFAAACPGCGWANPHWEGAANALVASDPPGVWRATSDAGRLRRELDFAVARWEVERPAVNPHEAMLSRLLSEHATSGRGLFNAMMQWHRDTGLGLASCGVVPVVPRADDVVASMLDGQWARERIAALLPGLFLLILLLFADKTCGCLIGDRTYHPVYGCFGNFPGTPTRDSMWLIALLPIVAGSRALRQRVYQQCWHTLMTSILMLPDPFLGRWRIEPFILADHEEMGMNTLVRIGGRCPCWMCMQRKRTIYDDACIAPNPPNAVRQYLDDARLLVKKHCKDASVAYKMRPWFQEFPTLGYGRFLVDLFHIDPAGLLKHMRKWLRVAATRGLALVGGGIDAVNAELRRRLEKRTRKLNIGGKKADLSCGKMGGQQMQKFFCLLPICMLGLYPDAMVRAVLLYVTWSQLLWQPSFTPAAIAVLRVLRDRWVAAWIVFVALSASHLNFIKLHMAAAHVIDQLVRYGPPSCYSTREYERFHKWLKAAIRGGNFRDDVAIAMKEMVRVWHQ
eukprot:gene20545-46340_t